MGRSELFLFFPEETHVTIYIRAVSVSSSVVPHVVSLGYIVGIWRYSDL